MAMEKEKSEELIKLFTFYSHLISISVVYLSFIVAFPE